MFRSHRQRVRPSGFGIWAALALCAPVVAATPAGGQNEILTETVEVRVVNVDVVATDSEGATIRGLTKDNFELIVDGRQVPIEYFSALEALSGNAQTSAAGQDAEAQGLPFLIIDYDARFARPGEARQALGVLRAALEDLLASTRAIMIARQGMNLVIEEPFTRDRAGLEAALARLVEMDVPIRLSAERALLTSRLERSVNPGLSGTSQEVMGVLDTARSLFSEVRSLSQQESVFQRTAVAQLESLIGSVAGLPGRKALLYLGPGIEPQPAEALFRLWWSKFSSVADALGISSIESEMGQDLTTARITGLLEKANEGRVAFYGHDPRGVRAQSSAAFESLAASELTARDVQAAQDWILALARGSGGEGRVNSSDLAGLVSEMTDGFRNYYSLGFTPTVGFPEKGRVRVKLVNSDGRLRHFDRYITRSGSRKLEELALAALLTDMALNPMDIQIEVGEPESQHDRTFVVPLLVKIPFASLTLVPKGTQHVGKLSVVVQAQGSGGGISELVRGVVPIEVDNENLLEALGRRVAYRLQLRVAPGEQKVAIGVRDEISQRDSALRILIRTGRGS